jgi:superfamily II DNA/RNA helicase
VVRVLVAVDVASRGLDIPAVDLVGCERRAPSVGRLPRSAVSYVRRVGRTVRFVTHDIERVSYSVNLAHASSGQGSVDEDERWAVRLSESDMGLLHAAERIPGRHLDKCLEVNDVDAIKVLGVVAKAARLVKIKLMGIGFDELVLKFKERKLRGQKERERIERALRRLETSSKTIPTSA